MKQFVFIGALCLFTCGTAFAQSTPSPAPAATSDAVAARAKDMLHEFQTGTVDRTQLDAQMNAAMTGDVLKKVQAQFAPLGDPQQFAFTGKQTMQGGNEAYVYRVTFKSGTFNEIFTLDKDGKVAGFFLVPQKQ